MSSLAQPVLFANISGFYLTPKNDNQIYSILPLIAIRTEGFLMKLLIGLLHQGPPRCESTSIVWNVKFKKIHFCFAF